MRIASVQIQNFRCLEDVEIDFDSITTFIGPNGSGKSTVLRALDWFFNGEKTSLDISDVYGADDRQERQVRVRVTFDSLTDADRSVLGPKYAPSGVSDFTAWRTWSDGQDKIAGKAMAFLPFEAVRAAQGAGPKKAALAEVRENHPDLDIPAWTTVAGTEDAMSAWEREHSEYLDDAEVSDTHFFGFNGQGKLSGLFDYVFVTADLRASEESSDARGTILSRILEKAIDSSAAAHDLEELATAFAKNETRINQEHLGDQLEELGNQLTAEVANFTPGREIRLRTIPTQPRPVTPKVGIAIADAAIETSVERQGHGFQRALLVAALRVLATHGIQTGSAGVICLAIEEPELYQHPTQARAFASVLRELVDDRSGEIQIAYATHSPYFVEPRYFDQLRRVTRRNSATQLPIVKICSASIETVCARLEGFEDQRAIHSRWEQVCLKNLAEAFFADGVILVEGDDEKAIFEGVSAPRDSLAVAGITVAAAHGKAKILVPQAILDELGVNTLIVFDNDSGLRGRMISQGRDSIDIETAELSVKDQNRKLLRYFGIDEEDYPKGIYGNRLVALDDTLETMLARDWPEWEQTRSSLIASGQGATGKNAATYALAARECLEEPTGELAKLIGLARRF